MRRHSVIFATCFYLTLMAFSGCSDTSGDEDTLDAADSGDVDDVRDLDVEVQGDLPDPPETDGDELADGAEDGDATAVDGDSETVEDTAEDLDTEADAGGTIDLSDTEDDDSSDTDETDAPSGDATDTTPAIPCDEFAVKNEVCRGETCATVGLIPRFEDKFTNERPGSFVEGRYLDVDGGRWFLVSQYGKALSFAPDGTSTQAVDIGNRLWTGGSETGFLGLAFPPDFSESEEVYLSYTSNDGNASVVSRMNVNTTDWTFDKSSEEILLKIPQPANNHNGGKIAFGPDGYLYVSIGDGGGSGDRYNNGQDKNTLLGAILRIDVTSDTTAPEKGYAIPADNPFVGEEGADEIYAYGLRNVWKFSFDSEDGRLFAADVGQNDFEEVDIITNGGNYGWPLKEAFSCYDAAEPCDDLDVIDPIWSYDHGEGRSITGGYVYHGEHIEFFEGLYIVADYTNGRMWYLEDTGDIPWSDQVFLGAGFPISGFVEGPDNELYILRYPAIGDPAVYELAAPSTSCE